MTEMQQNEGNTRGGDKKMLIAMSVIGIICAFFIVITYQGTLGIITKNRAEALNKAVYKVIPGISRIQPYSLSKDKSFSVVGPDDKSQQKVFAGYDSTGTLKGIAIQASGKAYGEVLSLLYGYSPAEQKIIGFYVLESKETPGIGDKIEIPPFLDNFKGLDVSLRDDLSGLKNPITTVKQGKKTKGWEIDGITGATITSRGVGNILNTSAGEWMPLICKNKKSFEMQNTEKK